MIGMKKWYLVLIVLLSGCSATPAYVNSTSPQAASVDGDVVGLFRFIGGQAHVQIAEIDGIRTSGPSPFLVSPGTHEIGVVLNGDGKGAIMQVKESFKPNQKYKLTGDFSGITTRVRVLDVTDKNPILVSEHKEKQSIQPVNNTIVVPVIVR